MDMQMAMKEEGITVEMPMTFAMDVQPPDRTHGTVSISLLGVTIETEVISIGDTAYVKDPETGEWSIETEETSTFSPEDFSGFEPADIEDLVLVGETKLNGTPVYLLKGTISARDMGDGLGDIQGRLQVKYWIAVKSGRLKQSLIDGEISETAGEALTLRLEATTTYSAYGKTVAIQPP
jgi:hypothetical protein